MRIVHAISDLNFSSGGPVRAIIDLSAKLAERGHEVRVLTFEDNDAPAPWRGDTAHNPCTIALGTRHMRGFRLSGEQREVMRETIAWGDVVHAHGIWTPMALLATNAARAAGRPYTISLRGMLDDWCMEQRRLKKLVYLRLGGSRMLNGAALIHSTAEGELAQSKKWFPKADAMVIPNLLNLDPFENMPDRKVAEDAFPFLGGDEPVLLYLSRLHYKKGVEHLIRAVRELVDSGKPHRLLIAGDGDASYIAQLKGLTAELGLEDRVAFLGLVVGDEKIALFRAADLFVLPTSQENFGFVLYESLAAGTPIVTTKGVDTWPELQSEAHASICEQTPASIAQTVASLTGDAETLEEKGRLGRAWIFERMHPDTIISQFERFYERAATGSAS